MSHHLPTFPAPPGCQTGSMPHPGRGGTISRMASTPTERLTTFVTGCDHGLGLAVARAALQRGDRVFAVCLRSRSAGELKALRHTAGPRLTILAADLSSEQHLKRVCGVVRRKAKRLDLLVNVAGAYWRDGLDKLTGRDLHRMFAINAFAPALLIRHLRPLLKAAQGVVVNISSEAGGIADVDSNRPILAYAASKTALNMLTRKLAFELAPDGVRLFAIHPGWMKTPMGRKEGAPMQDPADTARDVLRLSAHVTPSMNGGFFNHDGSARRW